jgi:hypothetical protein
VAQLLLGHQSLHPQRLQIGLPTTTANANHTKRVKKGQWSDVRPSPVTGAAQRK